MKSALLGGQLSLCVGPCVWDTSSKVTERLQVASKDSVRQCTKEGFWLQTLDCCTLVRCLCWKTLLLNVDRHSWFFSLSTAHVAVAVNRKPLERKHGSSHGNGSRKTKGPMVTKRFLKNMILKESNPCVTPTESCASDEREEDEEQPFRAPPGLSDSIG